MLRHLTQTTKSVPVSTVERVWTLVDIKGKILGRAATEIANKLSGKNKVSYSHNTDVGDYIVVINASQVQVTGRKALSKVYTNYSGYPGGLKKEALGKAVDRIPEQVVRRAISGMLPKNKLRDVRLARLHIYAEDKHPYVARLAKSKN